MLIDFDKKKTLHLPTKITDVGYPTILIINRMKFFEKVKNTDLATTFGFCFAHKSIAFVLCLKYKEIKLRTVTSGCDALFGIMLALELGCEKYRKEIMTAICLD